jgi:autotransporter-associated beta strand protein
MHVREPRNAALVLALLACAGTRTAIADTFQWASPANGTWSTGTNWALGTAPPVGGALDATLRFGSPSASNYTATNDLGGVVTLNHLIFSNNTKAFNTVTNTSGSGIAFDGVSPTFDLNGYGERQTLASASGGLGVALNTNVALSVSSLGSLLISAPMSGPGGLTIQGTELASNVAVIQLASGAVNNNTFSGGLTLNSGNLYLDGQVPAASPVGTGTLTINGGNIGFNSTTTRIAVPVVVNSNLLISRGTGTINGQITFNNPSAVLQIFGGSLFLNVPGTFGGATILGGRENYAASTGPATLTLGTNTNASTDGTLLNTPAISLLGGATLNIDNSSNNLSNRVNDAAPITMESATISFRANSAGSTETVGALSVAGFSVLEARPGSASPNGAGSLAASSISRSDHGVLFVRGQNLGVPASSAYSLISTTGAAPGLIGGGGAPGSNSMSIVPWAVAAYSTSNSTTFSPNSLATYDPVNGFRPLNPSTEFATAPSTDSTQNVMLTGNVSNDLELGVNSLVLSSPSNVSITGAGIISVASGAVLASLGGGSSSISNALSFNSNEAVITCTGPLRVTGSLIGSGGLTKSGSNLLILSADNTGLTGPLTINGGSLVTVFSEQNLPGTGPVAIHSVESTACAGIGVSDNNVAGNDPITVTRPIVSNSGLAALSTQTPITEATFTGDISGDGGLIINSTGSFGLIELAGNNTYKGITRVNAGSLRIHSDANLGAGGALTLAANSGNEGLEIVGDWTTSRTVHMLNQSAIETNGYNAVLNGPLTGGVSLSKYGSGSLTLNANSSYDGTMTVLEGAVMVNAIVPATVVDTASTVIGGTGRIGDLTLQGTLSPGSAASPFGTISMSSLKWAGLGTVAFDLGASDLISVDTALTKDTSTGTQFVFAFNEAGPLTVGASYDLIHFASTTFAASDFSFTGPAGLDGYFELTSSSLAFHITSLTPPCYANCDGSTLAPMLNVADFTCFLQKYAAADPYANCDQSTTPPVLNVADFTCFLQKYAAGCP